MSRPMKRARANSSHSEGAEARNVSFSRINDKLFKESFGHSSRDFFRGGLGKNANGLVGDVEISPPWMVDYLNLSLKHILMDSEVSRRVIIDPIMLYASEECKLVVDLEEEVEPKLIENSIFIHGKLDYTLRSLGTATHVDAPEISLQPVIVVVEAKGEGGASSSIIPRCSPQFMAECMYFECKGILTDGQFWWFMAKQESTWVCEGTIGPLFVRQDKGVDKKMLEMVLQGVVAFAKEEPLSKVLSFVS
eukprot:TRINITY_DN3049_c0_g1_i1.p1 TRINITY_DN3049_c0_g1~~TRINITY_DN3049_c0_g1_i1.p1  ORF type:complete len:249 (-),score=42.87 TRINITY_DN3049_c0_g1_i1:122-868(-)